MNPLSKRRTSVPVKVGHVTIGGDAPIVRRKLRPGEGIISNNTLHNRAGFTNAPGAERLFYRARYHDRIAGTGLADLPGGVLNF